MLQAEHEGHAVLRHAVAFHPDPAFDVALACAYACDEETSPLFFHALCDQVLPAAAPPTEPRTGVDADMHCYVARLALWGRQQDLAHVGRDRGLPLLPPVSPRPCVRLQELLVLALRALRDVRVGVRRRAFSLARHLLCTHLLAPHTVPQPRALVQPMLHPMATTHASSGASAATATASGGGSGGGELCGWLSKLGALGRPRRRWFILRGTTLLYCSQPGQAIPRGRVLLRGCEISRPSRGTVLVSGAVMSGSFLRSLDTDLLLAGPHMPKQLRLRASSSAERDAWLTALRAAALDGLVSAQRASLIQRQHRVAESVPGDDSQAAEPDESRAQAVRDSELLWDQASAFQFVFEEDTSGCVEDAGVAMASLAADACASRGQAIGVLQVRADAAR